MTSWRGILGRRGERLAVQRLRELKYEILDQNVRSLRGEMDIVAMDGETLVFCEVRTRSAPAGAGIFGAGDSIHQGKQRRLQHLAEAYLQNHPGLSIHPCRFDVVLVENDGENWNLELIQDAFRPGW